ncbi:kelch repeat protein-like protein [Periconia macrospinosa]|uniref:Kelch repeat protein-like protein n=1 Tax=Periconia macrospinosa TaxID=97972 RepID=A0A2V1D847_9PLEO|nr:kelch repeat protein-like protein [Periconia macrospinosa]
MERVRPQPANQRKSVFAEVGLIDLQKAREERNTAPVLVSTSPISPRKSRPARTVRFRSQNEILNEQSAEENGSEDGWESASDSDDDFGSIEISHIQQDSSYTKIYRLGLLTVVFAMLLPVLQIDKIVPVGVRGGVIPREVIEVMNQPQLERRDDSQVEVCKRWSGQSTVLNGTLYMYGFRTLTDAKQTDNTWTNDFLSLDLTKSWQIANPSLTGLPRPSGPPAVSLGSLWNSHSSLYLYGGQFSDTPKRSPTSNSLWEYKVKDKEWIEHKDPKSSAGDNADDAGQPVQRASEGAGFSVANLGRGWYFGGHLDDFTTEGWSNQVPRVYLKSLLEFTFPGYSNEAVQDLKNGKKAGNEGVFRNVTEGGLQGTGSFPARADGTLVYIPGFGDQGTLLGLTGGDNDTFATLNLIDVYDIAKSTWYKQSTSGTMPKYRVNPCAVVAAAADGSSYNVYMFGGQNLQPAKEQTQYDDMWILSIPSFTWIEVDQSKQSVPYARAGHSCHIWDGQMIVVGGYVGQELSCEYPGIYVFNTSSLQWSDQFTALSGDKALKPWNGQEKDDGNPLAQQANQRGFDANSGLQGSYGYAVPKAVQSVIGGKETGGATLTAPVQTPTEGPFKTGTARTYTVTGPSGAIVTETVDGGNSTSGGGRGRNVGAIVAGVVAGVFFIIAAYFAFCAWIYRRQVKLWKEHAAMVTARAANEKNDTAVAPVGTNASSYKGSSERARRDMLGTRSSNGTGGAAIRTSDERAASSTYTGAAGVAAASGAGAADALGRRSSADSSTDDLLQGLEPSFWGPRGVLLNPRRSLRVINRD